MYKVILILFIISTFFINGCDTNNSSGWNIYNTENSDLPENRLTCIAIEENGTKWIGTRYGGLAKLNNNEWTVYNSANSILNSDYIHDIMIDNFNNKWIITSIGGSHGELIRISGNIWTNYNDLYDLDEFNIRSIAIDIDNTIWIVTRFDGIIHIDGENVTIYDDEELGIDVVYYFYITIDSNGIKWIGTSNGLIKFDNSEWTIYNTENSEIPYNYVGNITIENSEIRWLGCYGVTVNNGLNWINYSPENSELPEYSVRTICIDGFGTKWIGTDDFLDYDYHGGLIKYDGSNWTIYRTENSELPDNNVFDIAIDEYNTIWICTDNGLAAFYNHDNTSSNIVEYQND